MDEAPDAENRVQYDAFTRALVIALGVHAGKDVEMAAVSARPLAAYWHFHTAHQAARRTGVASPAPWIEAVAAAIEDQGVTIPPAWWVGYHCARDHARQLTVLFPRMSFD